MDKKLNEVTKVTDMAYVPVIMADGSIGQIAKSDLASVVAGVIGDANQNKSGLLSVSNYKKSPIDLLMSAGKLYEIAKICKDYRSAIIEVYGVKSPSWDANKPIQTVIIGMHTDNTTNQAIDVRKDSDMIDVYYDSSSVYIKNNYTYAIQVNIVFKQMGDKGEEFMIPTLSTKDVSELNKAREVGTVFGYNTLAELAGGVAGMIAPGLGGTMIHGGILSIVEGETQTISLGSGMLILNTQGAAVCSVYYIDYWSSSIKVIHESGITNIGLNLSKGEKTSEILISSYKTRKINYLFIGELF